MRACRDSRRRDECERADDLEPFARLVTLGDSRLLDERVDIPADLPRVAGGIDDDHQVDVGAAIGIGLGGIGLAVGARAIEPDGTQILAQLLAKASDEELNYAALAPGERCAGEGGVQV